MSTEKTTPMGTTPPTTSAATATGHIGTLTAAATVVAPVVLLASSVAWALEQGGARAALQLWAFVAFALVAVGLASRLAPHRPTGATVALGLGLVGAAGGVAYATEAAIVDYFGIDRLNDHASALTVVVLQLPGTVFPVSLLVFAALLWRTASVARPLVIALAVGAVVFPASRMPEVAGLAVAGDALLAIGLVPLGLSALRDRSSNARA